jgi:hypothetical protein
MSIVVFLSTVSDEFRTYRDHLVHDLTRQDVAVKVQEDFKDLGGDTLDKLDACIAHCDAVVHLVGEMCGTVADERQQKGLLAKHSDLQSKLPPLGEALKHGLCLPYTQWEAWLALYHAKPLMIAKAAAGAQREPNYAPTDASHAAQAEHLKRLEDYHRYSCEFASPDDLAKQIAYSAILDLLVADYAEKAARDREVAEGFIREMAKRVAGEQGPRSRAHETGGPQRDRYLREGNLGTASRDEPGRHRQSRTREGEGAGRPRPVEPRPRDLAQGSRRDAARGGGAARTLRSGRDHALHSRTGHRAGDSRR